MSKAFPSFQLIALCLILHGCSSAPVQKQEIQDPVIVQYTEAIKADPKNKTAYAYRAAAYYARGHYQNVIDDCTKAIELGLNEPKLYSYRGSSYYGLGQFQNAVADFSKEITILPSITAYESRAAANNSQHHFQEAITDCTQAIKFGAHDAYVYANRAYAYNGAKEFQKAVDDCDKTISLSPDYPSAYDNRATAYENLGKKDLAAQDRAKAKELATKPQQK